MPNKKTEKELEPKDELVYELKLLNKNLKISNRQGGYLYSFGRGIVTAFGYTIGFAVVLTLTLSIMNKLSFIPGLSDIATNLRNWSSRY